MVISSSCGVDSPLEEIDWLKKEVTQGEQNPTAYMKYCYITQAQLNGQSVIVYQDFNPAINKIYPNL